MYKDPSKGLVGEIKQLLYERPKNSKSGPICAKESAFNSTTEYIKTVVNLRFTSYTPRQPSNPFKIALL